jgi:AbrB family looped-hinge helix DNA binding protein
VAKASGFETWTVRLPAVSAEIDKYPHPSIEFPDSGIPEIWNMETVKLGKKGQMSIPKDILKRLGLEGEATLLVDTTPEGAIVLRPAAVYPIEIYSEERVRDFDTADRMDAKTAAHLARILKKK